MGGWTEGRKERWKLGPMEGHLEDEWSDKRRGRTKKTEGRMDRGIKGQLDKFWAGWLARRVDKWRRDGEMAGEWMDGEADAHIDGRMRWQNSGPHHPQRVPRPSPDTHGFLALMRQKTLTT